MWRRVPSTTLAATLVLGFAGTAAAQSKAAKIANAMAAAPTSIAKNAAVKDWPDETGKMATLREGSNGWVCYPSRPKTKYRKNSTPNACCTLAAPPNAGGRALPMPVIQRDHPPGSPSPPKGCPGYACERPLVVGE